MTGINFEIGVDGNLQSIVDLPRHVEQLLRKVFRGSFHVDAIVRAGGENTEVIQVFIKHETVYGRKLVQVSFSWSFYLDVGCKLDFISCPTFYRHRTSRRCDQRYRAAVVETTYLTARRGARQQWYFRRNCLLRKDWINRSKKECEQQKGFRHRQA